MQIRNDMLVPATTTVTTVWTMARESEQGVWRIDYHSTFLRGIDSIVYVCTFGLDTHATGECISEEEEGRGVAER